MSSRHRTLKRIASILGLVILMPAVIFAVLVAWPASEASAEKPLAAIAIVNASIVDIRAGRLVRDQSVVVSGDRITAVGPAHLVEVPPGARIINGRGTFVMPALWDMHTHVYAVSPLLDMPLYIAYGVTNVRDLQGCPAQGDPFIACHEDKKRWTAEAVAGVRVGPRIFETSSFMANGPGMADRLGKVPRFFDVANADQARRFVRYFVGRADTIKVYDGIPREAYFALVDEASRADMAVVGHKPRAISAVEAAKHQRSIEHARFLLHESFDGADALRASAGTPAWKEDRRAMVDRHDPVAAARIFKAMRRHGTYYVPTHLTRWSDAYADSPQVREDPALEYLHPLMKMQWLEDVNALIAADPGPQAREAYIDFYEKGLELTGQAHDAGVRIMVGTDYIAPGLDVHRELEQLVKAGLSPQEALAAATIVPAGYARMSDKYGDIVVGKVADLIVLGADPLADIRNTRSIEAVVFNGALYDQQAIAGLKDQVKANARSWSAGAKILWRFILNPANY